MLGCCGQLPCRRRYHRPKQRLDAFLGHEEPRLVSDDLGVAAMLLVPGQPCRWRPDQLEPLGTRDPRGSEHQRIEASGSTRPN